MPGYWSNGQYIENPNASVTIGGNYGLNGIQQLMQRQQSNYGTQPYGGINTYGSSGGSNNGGAAYSYTAPMGNSTYNLTNQQQGTQDLLSNYYSTGNYGDMFQAGEAYSGDLGYYQLGEGEQTAMNLIQNLIDQGDPEGIQLAMDEYRNVLEQDAYDPYDERGSFNGYRQNVLNELEESGGVLNRNLAATGDLYSTRAAQEQGNLAESAQNQLTTELGRLYDAYTNRRANTANSAGQLGVYQNQLELQEADAMRQMGETQRILQDTQAKDAYNAELARRSELQDLVDRAFASIPQQHSGSSSSGGSSGSSSNTNSSSNNIQYDTAGNAGTGAQRWWRHDSPAGGMYYGYRPGSNWI